jgi:hypothetical protein
MGLGTPPQPLAPTLLFRAVNPYLAALSGHLVVAEEPTSPTANSDRTTFHPGQSSTYTRGEEVPVIEPPTVDGARYGTDMMALNGVVRKQTLGTATQGTLTQSPPPPPPCPGTRA